MARWITVDGNKAAASVAYRLNDLVVVYPITPASTMGEWSDEWSAQGQLNIFGSCPEVIEMQSEGGAAGAVHGALQAGALTTTFTASQGLLLMLPNLYKIAGELTAAVIHVAARSIAAHALSIFGDHSDVMACRGTGFAMLASSSVQEAQDFACIAQLAALESRIPFLHFFDGFRTSHEIAKIVALEDEDLRALIPAAAMLAHAQRALTPEHPVLRGTAQNPDVFFQAREACNPFYLACPGFVREAMTRFAERTGRRYRLFDYFGHPEAERVLIIMGSGAEVAHEAIERLIAAGERVGVLKVRLLRPFALEDFCAALPSSVRSVAVLDRTKEPGALGDPLYLDVVAALNEAGRLGEIRVIGGRYGLSSKEFDPAMVKRVLDELRAAKPKNHFTIGIVDDVTHSSLALTEDFESEDAEVVRALFYGLGADGTVGANKNTIEMIGEGTELFAQGYFVYDSKKSGAMTISHLRFGPRPIRSSYQIRKASFVAIHQFEFLERLDVLARADHGATLLLNTPYAPEALWERLPAEVQAAIIEKGLEVFTIDAQAVASEQGMARRINTIMQTCFFAISKVFPREEAIARIKAAVTKSYERKGDEVVRRNHEAIDATLARLFSVPIPAAVQGRPRPPIVADAAPDFFRRVTAAMLAGHGDDLPVSAFPPDGTWPLNSSRWEKRNIALEIPVWEPELCIQCNKCVFVCPHAAIRATFYDGAALAAAPAGFKSTPLRDKERPGLRYTLQVAPEDCTGCHLCVRVCPAKDKSSAKRKAINMAPQAPLRETERQSYDFFLGLPKPDRAALKLDVKGSQFLEPLFECSGACAGCGETPYIKLLTQLFGDRALIANATGCSSIYSGNLPTTPYSTNAEGRGPAWSNSLFEDNAEFGLGFRLAIDSHRRHALRLLSTLAPRLNPALVATLTEASRPDEANIPARRAAIVELRRALAACTEPAARELSDLADHVLDKSVWLVGGDGWAYDIGFGGLDHVLASGRDVNVLVLDTEVYSNTGGQQSKATPMGAAAKFAVAGKASPKKDLGLLAMSYGNIYVARVAFGAKDAQTLQAFREAESYPGPSLIIAYSHCIAHGYDLAFGAEQQRLAVESGTWPLYRFDPRRVLAGLPPLQLDSGPPTIPVTDYMRRETRFRLAESVDPKRFERLIKEAQHHAERRQAVYEQLAGLRIPIDV